MQKVLAVNTTQGNSAKQLTRTLLVCGMVAGPLFTVVGLSQAFTRPGFNLTRHALSLLENGDLGWLQITNFLLCGLLFIAGAVGMRRVLRGSRGGMWGPLLVGICGVGMIGAGCFTADPGLGFPLGTPDAPAMTLSGHGLGHMLMGSLSFLTMIAACFVFARRFASQKQYGWVIYSVATGVLFFIAFAGVSMGNLWLNSAFVFTALNAYIWVSVMAARLLAQQAHVSAH